MDIDLTCPTCRHLDQVQTVPAICSGGASTEVGYGTHTGVGFTTNGVIPVVTRSTTTRTRTTALARSLARDPGLESTSRRTRIAIVLLIPAVVMLAASIGALFADLSGSILARIVGGVIFVGGTSAPGLLVVLSIWAAKRRNRTVRAGLPAADRLWRSAFYCHRCGHVFWPVSPEPTVPARVALSPPNFRWAVWSAGGYAQL
ncbi:hypothetical protein [Nocardia sp. NPDC058497]|uniref:hypothetical protein n=1 Tax=Nocardia sp. NPDC058497 TaxID=3346529 RepID=UPI003655A39A